MIISDLSYWKSVVLETSIVGGITIDKTVDVDKAVNINVETDLDITSTFDVTAWGTWWFDVTAEGNVQGNLADVQFEVSALGENSVAEADLSVVATDNLSEVSGSLFAAVN